VTIPVDTPSSVRGDQLVQGIAAVTDLFQSSSARGRLPDIYSLFQVDPKFTLPWHRAALPNLHMPSGPEPPANDKNVVNKRK